MSFAVKIIQPSGILDGILGSQLRQEVEQAAQAGAKAVLVDFTEVTFMDSSGLGTLVMTLKIAREAGGNLFLCSINPQVNLLLEISGIDAVIEVFSDKAAFENAVLMKP